MTKITKMHGLIVGVIGMGIIGLSINPFVPYLFIVGSFSYIAGIAIMGSRKEGKGD